MFSYEVNLLCDGIKGGVCDYDLIVSGEPMEDIGEAQNSACFEAVHEGWKLQDGKWLCPGCVQELASTNNFASRT